MRRGGGTSAASFSSNSSGADPLSGIDEAATDPLSGALARGNLPLDRGGTDRNQQGLVLPQRIEVALVQQAATLQQAHNALGRGLDDLLHVVIGEYQVTAGIAARGTARPDSDLDVALGRTDGSSDVA